VKYLTYDTTITKAWVAALVKQAVIWGVSPCNCFLVVYSQLISANHSFMPITVAARSRSWTVFVRSKTEIVCSNPTQSIGVCVRLFCVCVVQYVGSGLGMSWSRVQGVQQHYETEEESRAKQKDVGPLMKEWKINNLFITWPFNANNGNTACNRVSKNSLGEFSSECEIFYFVDSGQIKYFVNSLSG
jgi:hypothetical protein